MKSSKDIIKEAEEFLNETDLQFLKNDIPIKVSGIDRITGGEEWDSSINSLIDGGWIISEDDIKDIMSGKSVKKYSPNGRRVINIMKK